MRHIQLASGYLTAVQSIEHLGGSCTWAGKMLEAVTLGLHAWKTAWKKITRETTTDGKTPVCVWGGGEWRHLLHWGRQFVQSQNMECRCPFKCFVAPCHTVVKPTLTPLLCSLLPGFIMCSVCIVVCRTSCRCSWSCTFSSP